MSTFSFRPLITIAILAYSLIGNICYSNITWANKVDVTTTTTSITKTGAVGWNAGATSVETLSGNGYLEFTKGLNKAVMIGLSKGNSSASYTDIDYAIYFTGTNNYLIYESGSNIGQFGSFSDSDIFKVEVIGSTIKYLKNGTVFYTSTKPISFPLNIDTSLHYPDSVISNISLVDATATPQPPNSAPSLTAPSGSVTDTTPTFGWSSVSTATGYKLNVKNTATNSNVINTSISATSYTPTTALPTGNYSWTVTAYNTAGNGPISTIKTFSVTLPSSGGITWANKVDVTTTTTSITKTGAVGWNAGATSVETLTGDGYLQFTKGLNKAVMIGLSKGNSSSSFGDIDYAIYFTGTNNYLIYESGSNKGQFGSFSDSDIFKVEVVGSTIKYLKNGAVFYTSAKPISFPLNIDTSLHYPDSVISNISLVDATATPQPLFMGKVVEGISGQDVDVNEFLVNSAGNTLTLTGNTWKAINYLYNVTPNTVLKFDFRSAGQEPEINGIGFTNSLSQAPSQNRGWQVYGTQNWAEAITHANYSGNGWVSYSIPIGQTFTGNIDYMVFVGDDDGVRVSQNSQYANPRLVEVSPPQNQYVELNFSNYIAESWDSRGDPDNLVLENCISGDKITGFEAVNVVIQTIGRSYFSEAIIYFSDSNNGTNGIELAIGAGDNNSGIQTFNTNGVLDISDLGHPDVISLADKRFTIQFYEVTDDYSNEFDAKYSNGTLKVWGENLVLNSDCVFYNNQYKKKNQ